MLRDTLIAAVALTISACGYNTIPCSDLSPQSALIDVLVDWSKSGIDIDADVSGDEGVFRLSLRFFPEDGGEVFERYLDNDIESGTIEVPVGRYSVIALNESIYDTYWSGAITFTDVDDYELFAGELVTSSTNSASPPKVLVAWAIPMFEVTTDMAFYTRGITGIGDVLEVATLTSYEQEQVVALKSIVMEPRTKSLRVEVTTQNLGSAKSISASVSGLSRRVNIVTGDTEPDAVSHTIDLAEFTYDVSRSSRDDTVSSDASGVASGEQLCFAHSDDYEDDYTLTLDVYLSDGTVHEDTESLTTDVSDSVVSTDDDDDYLVEHSIELPIVEGGTIDVEDWVDEEDIIL